MKKLILSEFELLKQRVYVPIHIYRGNNSFLRVGPKSVIGREVRLHRKLLKLGFPVPKILRVGKIDNKFFFEEESLGAIHFGKIFAAEYKKNKKISNGNFDRFLKVVLRFAEAQIKTAGFQRDNQSFLKGTNLSNMLKELPAYRHETLKAWKKIIKKTSTLPFVLTHGDFGPFNMYPGGIIDLESFFKAPFGYDLVTAIYMNVFFPTGSKYELHQLFNFTAVQRKKYFKEIDRLFRENELPNLSDFLNEFIWARCAWTTARMQKWPKIQSWRYAQYKKLLSAYLAGKDLTESL